MGTRFQFADFSQPRQNSNDTAIQLHHQDVEALFERYAPREDGMEDIPSINPFGQNATQTSYSDADVATSSLHASDSEEPDANEGEMFDHLEIRTPVVGRWDHMGSRFDTPEMSVSRVAPLDYCNNDDLLFQVIETLPEKKMRYLIHQICRDQPSAFRWFSRECLDMDCGWPLMKLRVGLRRPEADEHEDTWWHNEFWERRANQKRKDGRGKNNSEDRLRSPWMMDPSLPNPCPTCVPPVHEQIESTWEHGKARGKSVASSSSPHCVPNFEQQPFTCHQCGEEITKERLAEACVFHPPTGKHSHSLRALQ